MFYFRAVSYETQKPLTMCYVKYDYYGYEHADKDPVTALLTKSWREYGSCIKDVISFINNFEEYHKNANQLFYRYIGAQESIDRMTADRMKVFFHKKNIEPTFRCSRDGVNMIVYVFPFWFQNFVINILKHMQRRSWGGHGVHMSLGATA